jgi:hypothetical protein
MVVGAEFPCLAAERVFVPGEMVTLSAYIPMLERFVAVPSSRMSHLTEAETKTYMTRLALPSFGHGGTVLTLSPYTPTGTRQVPNSSLAIGRTVLALSQ